jgi:hypothetical protein
MFGLGLYGFFVSNNFKRKENPIIDRKITSTYFPNNSIPILPLFNTIASIRHHSPQSQGVTLKQVVLNVGNIA